MNLQEVSKALAAIKSVLLSTLASADVYCEAEYYDENGKPRYASWTVEIIFNSYVILSHEEISKLEEAGFYRLNRNDNSVWNL